MATQANNARSIASKMAEGLLEKISSSAVDSVGDYCVVKRFADEFNAHAVPALKEAGVKTKLRAVFHEVGTKCEIRKGNWFTDAFVTSVRASDLGGNSSTYVAKAILDDLPIRDREKIEHNMPRILGMK